MVGGTVPAPLEDPRPNDDKFLGARSERVPASDRTEDRQCRLWHVERCRGIVRGWSMERPQGLCYRHLGAFDRGDLDGLLDGLADDAVWITGEHVVRGRSDLAEFFGTALA
jgi:hypothetical protein